jgi:hypothetical protein
MTCQECQQRLQDRLDGRAAGGAAFETHLAACAACRGLHAAAARLEAGLRRLAPPCPPGGLRDRIVARVLTDRRRRAWRRRLAAGLALAASLLIVAVVALRWPRQPEVAAVPPPPAPEERPAPPDGPPGEPPPSLRDNVAEATSAVASLTRRTADETVGQGRLLVPSVSLPADPMGGAAPLEPPAQSLREAGQGVSTSLAPVTNSARRAVGLFLRDLPVTSEEKPGL